MLPAKIGDGVLGSSSGGVKPTGASLVGTSSAAAALMVVKRAVDLGGLTVVKEVIGEDCFHGEDGLEIDGVKREAWVAMAIGDGRN